MFKKYLIKDPEKKKHTEPYLWQEGKSSVFQVFSEP